MKAVFVFLALVAVASAAPLAEEEYQTLFTKFISQHNRVYENSEVFFHRYNSFKTNMNIIIAHQSQEGNTFTMAMNQFGDLTLEEFKAQYLNLDVSKLARNDASSDFELAVELPSSVDWPAKGAVTAVKNQGQCGSCWAFSTTGSTESAYFIQNPGVKLVSLSEQELVDCAGSAGNQGCNGGMMDQAFKWIEGNGGLCTEAAYPYTAADGTCQKSQCQSVVTVTGYTDVPANNLDALASAVAQQPVSVAVDAGTSAWQFYSGGVVSGACGTQLDHGVLAAGYGTLNGSDYWLVKNSWGAAWGESGYIYLGKTSGTGAGECGIAMMASYPKAQAA